MPATAADYRYLAIVEHRLTLGDDPEPDDDNLNLPSPLPERTTK